MERTKKIKELADDGKTPSEIMEAVNITKYSTFYQICRRNNIKTNGKVGRPKGSKDKEVRKSADYKVVKPKLTQVDIDIVNEIKNL